MIARIFFILVITGSCARATPIDTHQAVEIGGIRQWLGFKGIDDKAPVLLFLHGGPGNSAMAYSEKFTAQLQKYFVVVMWDQRESGQTLKLNKTDKPLSVDLMVSDAVEVIKYLSKRFSQQKIYLVGHSWGGFLALMVAQKNPELLSACIAVSPMINQIESEQLSLAWMRSHASKTKNEEALADLAKVTVPFDNIEQLYFDRKWTSRFANNAAPAKSFVLKWGDTWFNLWSQACQINLFDTAPEMHCPVYLFVGRRDRQTHFQVAEHYFDILKAQKKDLFWFDESGHNLNLTESAKFQQTVISILKSDN